MQIRLRAELLGGDLLKLGLLLLLLTTCAGWTGVPPETVESNHQGLAYHDLGPAATVRLSDERVVQLVINGRYVEASGAGKTTRLSLLDFANTHVLVGDVTGDGVAELLIELFPSRSGSCYELWSPKGDEFVQNEDLFCNPGIDGDALTTVTRDGPYSHITRYAADARGFVQWVTRYAPQGHHFGRQEKRAADGSISQVLVFRGLPECGQARVDVKEAVEVRSAPATAPVGIIRGDAVVLAAEREEMSADEWIKLGADSGVVGWVRAAELGDLEAAAQEQCSKN